MRTSGNRRKDSQAHETQARRILSAGVRLCVCELCVRDRSGAVARFRAQGILCRSRRRGGDRRGRDVSRRARAASSIRRSPDSPIASSGRKADGATIWHWASITKTFTAIAIMQLRDRGRLAIDDPIIKYVPELAEVHNRVRPDVAGDDPAAPVPLERASGTGPGRSVVTSPGIRSSRPGGASWSRCCPTPKSSSRRDRSTQYSNPGYVYLGQTIERLAGEDFEVYMQKNVLSPLGMTRSYYDVTPYHLLARPLEQLLREGRAGRRRTGSTSIPGSPRRMAGSTRRSSDMAQVPGLSARRIGGWADRRRASSGARIPRGDVEAGRSRRRERRRARDRSGSAIS